MNRYRPQGASIMTDSGRTPGGEVYEFLSENGLEELTEALSWVSTVEDLYPLKAGDPSFVGARRQAVEHFLSVIAEHKRCAGQEFRRRSRSDAVHNMRNVSATVPAMTAADRTATLPVRTSRSGQRKVQSEQPEDYMNMATHMVHGGKSDLLSQASKEQLKLLMIESDSEEEDEEDVLFYQNMAAIELNEARVRGTSSDDALRPPASDDGRAAGIAAATAEEDIDSVHKYVNQDAIELHTIEALQPWMHGPLDRSETERRLLSTKKNGAFLVRMKGLTGHVFVFSILLNKDSPNPKARFQHCLIEFFDISEKVVLIDNKRLPRPCTSLKSAVRIVCHAYKQRLAIGPNRVEQLLGVKDKFLESLEHHEKLWHLPQCTRKEAEDILGRQPPGVFLVRQSSQGGKCISIRLPPQNILNVIIEDTPDGFKVGSCQLPRLVHTLPEIARAISVDPTILKKTSDGVNVRLRPYGFPP